MRGSFPCPSWQRLLGHGCYNFKIKRQDSGFAGRRLFFVQLCSLAARYWDAGCRGALPLPSSGPLSPTSTPFPSKSRHFLETHYFSGALACKGALAWGALDYDRRTGQQFLKADEHIETRAGIVFARKSVRVREPVFQPLAVITAISHFFPHS